MNFTGINEQDVDRAYEILKKDATDGGYRINTDTEFVKNLVRGLLRNEQRYGYRACPCRLASGKKDEDLDIVCPCDYRDSDVEEHGACYCALYVNEAVATGTQKVAFVPERRPPRSQRGKIEGRVVQTIPVSASPGLSLPLP
ncbi:MAG: ferredoxin:glutaredoxin reductase, partial [Methanoregula sp.]|nr:ferredoxin:glutaredoxin reductase [Methanoregula sp.]